jgi:hypothetical protein
MKTNKLSFLMILTVIIFIHQGIGFAWYETHNLGLGNTGFKNNVDPWSFFTEIPNSPYVLLNNGLYFVTIDVPIGLVRDEYMFELGASNVIVLPDSEDGWNLYYNTMFQFGTVHISSNGEFKEQRWLNVTYENFANGIGIPQRNEIWYFTNKIFHFKAQNEEWNTFEYPQGWDTDMNVIYLYPSDDLESIIVVTKGKTIQDYEAMWFNTSSGESRMLYAEAKFFEGVYDVKQWNGHPGKYLILKKSQVIAYDVNNGTYEILVQDFGGLTENIMQDKTGKYVYSLNIDSISVIDLIEKKIDVHSLSLNEGDQITLSAHTDTIYDTQRRKIITYIRDKDYTKLSFALIDLDNFSLNYIQKLPDGISMVALFMQRDNRIVTTRKTQLYILDLDTMERIITIPLATISYKWSAIPGDPAPTIIPDFFTTTYFKKLESLGRLDNYYGGDGNFIRSMIFYPGTDIAFMQVDTGAGFNIFNYKEYDFKDNSITPFDTPPMKPIFLDPDPKNGQIIDLNGTDPAVDNGALQFIKSGKRIRSWVPPENSTPGNPKIMSYTRSLDTENDIYWAVYRDLVTKDVYFYEFSTKTQELLESFMVPVSDFISITGLVMDSTKKFLYYTSLKEVSQNIYDIYFIAFDIEKREIVTKILLATNSTTMYSGIILIPEQNRIFLWAHYGAWLIDSNNFNVIYGEVKDNPQVVYKKLAYIDGFFDEENNSVIIADLYTSNDEGGSPYKRILKVDLLTGNVINSYKLPDDTINQVFLSKDKKNFYMLSYDKPRFFVIPTNPAWKDPPTIKTSTNYIGYTPGDKARFNIHVTNGENSQKVNIYLWLCAPGNITLFFDGIGFSQVPSGIPVVLPANLDISGDILSIVIPQIMPDGFYQFNAIFLNDKYDIGSMGTWNFYVKN